MGLEEDPKPNTDLGAVIGEALSSFLSAHDYWIVPGRLVTAAHAVVDAGETEDPLLNELAQALEELRNLGRDTSTPG